MRFSTIVVLAASLALLPILGSGCSDDDGAADVSAQDVLAWNGVALEAMAATNQMPPMGARHLAMLHGAMYDALNAVDRRAQPFRVSPSVPARASAAAAMAHAAHRILTTLYPTRAAAFDTQLAASLAPGPQSPSAQALADGAAVGRAVADAIVAWRTGDGSEVMGMPYMGTSAPGQWVPTPPAYAGGIFTSWRYVVPFAMTSGTQFRPGPPPALDSAAYAADVNETQTVGSKTSTARTADQSMMAMFWVGMPGTVMEVGRMNQVVQQAVLARGTGRHAAARLFALVNVAMADAAIAGLDCKYQYTAWRPVTAIRGTPDDGNAGTTADAAWEPYLVTPAHPEYPSTHSALTSAATAVLAGFFGSDAADLALPDFMNPATTRRYSTFSQVSQEAGLSRIYGGIHFRFSFVAGTAMGDAVGAYVLANFMRPL